MDRSSRDIEWSHLSSLEEKRAAYALESYFRESLWDARVVLGERMLPILQRITLLVFKPEALVGRRVDGTMRFLADNGFTPIHYRPFTFTRPITREVWRFQWNASTLDKIDVSTLAFCALPTVMVVLRDDSSPLELPGSVRLKKRKGAAAPEARAPGTLRSVVSAPNRMITFVHTTDEPADVLREVGIFFDRPTRREFFQAILEDFRGDATAGCLGALKRLEARAPTSDFAPEGAWQRILARAQGQTRARLEAQRARFGETGKVDWEDFHALCADAGCDTWDIVSIGTAAIDYDDVGHAQLINFDRGGLDGWLNGKARLVPGES
ncbi:hypothetical protein LY474_04565 [Myxococcus stipitatus]|uniref:nucleoside-diphosphate kinase n=1 Tax=Myxococcus stipitatus TaxID=83455 RepID=UPI001F2497A2|nr:nucleoside-diphosphate kinase [Myxococcus stipitatus]MCE9667081.1 hypothetical protein [Myxococcus stipitatus]